VFIRGCPTNPGRSIAAIPAFPGPDDKERPKLKRARRKKRHCTQMTQGRWHRAIFHGASKDTGSTPQTRAFLFPGIRQSCPKSRVGVPENLVNTERGVISAGGVDGWKISIHP
jgi:hypothetical protein